MTLQTFATSRLGRSLAGSSSCRRLALCAALCLSGSSLVAQTPAPAKTAPANESTKYFSSAYTIHQSLEMGGRVASVSGSKPVWNTMVNQSSGARLLGQSLELRATPAKRFRLFDSLSTYSSGFGGDPNTLARLNAFKGRAWEFAGTFRRDRNFFDFNQFANSLSPIPGEFIRQQHSLHAYNTVRRNSDAKLTFLPLSRFSFSVGWAHATHEGPSLNTFRGSYTAELFQWFRNAQDVYSVGASFKPVARTAVNLDQSWAFVKADTSNSLASPNLPLWDMVAGYYQVSDPATPGLSTSKLYVTPGYTLSAATIAAGCGGTAVTANGITVPASTQAYFSNGLISPFCKAAVTDNFSLPMRTLSPTSRLSFVSNYFKKLAANAQLAYSSGDHDMGPLYWLQQGFTYSKPAYSSSTGWNNAAIGSFVTGANANGSYGSNHRGRVLASFALVAELTPRVSISESFSSDRFRSNGWMSYKSTPYTLPTIGLASTPTLATVASLWSVAGLNGAWPTGAIAGTTTTGTTLAGLDGEPLAGQPYFQKGKNTSNTLLGQFRLGTHLKLSAGWQFRTRFLDYASYPGAIPTDDMNWHANSALLGAVIENSPKARLSMNFEHTVWAGGAGVYAASFTRQEPVTSDQFKMRGQWKPTAWLDLALSGGIQQHRNNDVYVNLNRTGSNLSMAATVRANDKLSFDLNYAFDQISSTVDSCFQWATTNPANGFTIPYGATSRGTCAAQTTVNGEAVGGATYFLFNNAYKVPTTFYMAGFLYQPTKKIHLGGGMRYNNVHGSAAILNPIQTPASLNSTTFMPWADAEFKLASQWAWHGNWTYNGYGEHGTLNALTNGYYTYRGNGLAARNMHGNVLTLGMKYAF